MSESSHPMPVGNNETAHLSFDVCGRHAKVEIKIEGGAMEQHLLSNMVVQCESQEHMQKLVNAFQRLMVNRVPLTVVSAQFANVHEVTRK